jgi:hypothetical protein
MTTQNSATGCQQWPLLSAVLSSSPLVSAAGPLVSALAVYLWWKLVRRLTAWIVQWQRRRRFDFPATVSGSTRCRVLSLPSSTIVFHVKRRKRRRKRWKLWRDTPSPPPMPTPPTLDLSVVSPIFASDLFVWFISLYPPRPCHLQKFKSWVYIIFPTFSTDLLFFFLVHYHHYYFNHLYSVY